MSSATDNKYYCFRVADKAGNFGYGEIEVNLDVPTLTLSQSGSTVTATGSSLEDFQYFTSTSAITNCDSSKTSGWTAGSSKGSLADNTWICFKAKNDLDVYGYAKLQVDLSTPTLTLSQSGSTVTATGSSLEDFQYFTSTSAITNCDSSKSSGWTTGSSKGSLADNTWICFKAKNDLDVYGYAKLQVDLSTPTLTLSQSGSTVTATGSSLEDFQYFTSTSAITNCDSSKTSGWTAGSSKGSLADNTWICFKAKNDLDVYGYAKLQVDLSTPTITITQDQDSLDASATAPTGTSLVDSSWAHSGFLTSSPTCSSSITYESAGSDEDEVDISSTNNNKWVCFKVKNDLDVYGYAFAQIDFNAPNVSVTQGSGNLTASSTATDLPATPVWKYSGPLNNDPTCSSQTYSSSGNSVTSATDGKYYCFRVTDKAGNHGYGKVLVNSSLSLPTPTLTLTQMNRRVTASGTGLTGFAYFDSGATNPDCSASNSSASWTDGSTASSLDDNDWVCFKSQE